MKIFNICSKKVYTKNDEEKAAWLQVGRLVRFDATEDKPAQMKIELNMFPSQVFYVFEAKERDGTTEAKKPPVKKETETDESGIPF